MRRITEFDGVRALAVSLVILDHYAPFRSFANGATARYGGFGVDVFFVLSGFLITTILLDLRSEEHPYRIFYARRSLRILPAYALLLLLVFGVGALLHEATRMNVLAAQLLFLRSFKGTGALAGHVLHLLQHPSALPNLFRRLPDAAIPGDYGHYPMDASLGPTWSLSVEEWFYVLWAPVVLLLSRRAILVTASGVCVTGFLLRWISTGDTSFFTSVDVLVSGAFLALWMKHREALAEHTVRYWDRSITAISAFAAVALVVLSLLHRDTLSCTLLEIATFGALAWLIRHSGENNFVTKMLRLPPLLYIGGISYMIYLIHLPLYFVVRHIVEALPPIFSQMEREWIVAACSVVFTLLFATASWVLVEKPLLSHKDRMTAFLKRGSATPSVRHHEMPEALDLQDVSRSA